MSLVGNQANEGSTPFLPSKKEVRLNNVNLDKRELRSVVQTNRDNHRALFEEAMEGYKRLVVRELERKISDVERGIQIDHRIQLEIPEDHTKDYDRVLKMLDMSQDTSIELGERAFDQYVMDNWGWSEEFNTSSQFYSPT